MSATPYKLYSTLEEIDENQLDEHYAEFFQVMNFLFDDEVKDIKFKEVWKNYSHALSELKAGDSAIIRMKELAENAMYQGVSRTERISVMDSGDYTDDSSVKHHLQIDENDINSYIQMSRLLSKTDSNHSLPVDYAKSCPYLMSFMKKYKIKEQIEKYYIKHPDEFGSEREQCLLWLNRNKINKYDELPKTNARLEALKEKAFTGGAEKYLWIPPSLPYYEMQGAYKNSKGFSKILVFSAWEMVPRMIGALVSYTDTLGAITGSIAEAFYGIPAVLIAECKSRIDKGLMTDVLDEFDHVLGRSVDTYSDEVDETQANQMIEAAIDQYYIQQDKNGMLLFMEVMVTRMQQAGEVIVPYITENPFMSEEQISKVKAGDTISLDHDVRLKIETVKDADEKEWIGVFTSSEEMHKGSAGNVQMNQSIESILRLALNWEQVNGIVINPFGKYIQMTKKMIELLINGYEYNENERKSKDDENN